MYKMTVCSFCLNQFAWAETDLPEVALRMRKHHQGRSLPETWTRRVCDWVCPNCVPTAALRAQPWKQTWETHRWPMLSYADFAGICGLCRQDFVFSALEQQRMYEDLSVPLEVVPNHCSECRAIVREQKRAQKRLSELKPASAPEHEEAAELLALGGRLRKAVEHLRRARNLQTEQPEKARLAARIQQLVDLPDSQEPFPNDACSSNPEKFRRQLRERALQVKNKQ